MSKRQRIILAVLGLVLLLFVGRALVDFLAWRWWAAALGPAVLETVTNLQLKEFAFDLLTLAMASTWFVAQALLVARAISMVQVEHQVGNEFIREAIPTRTLLLGAVAIGLLLGVLTTAGGQSWADPVTLAANAPRYGVADPLLGTDIGDLAARLPLKLVVWQFYSMLVGLGLVFTTLLYMAIGALRWRQRRVYIHPDARRHLGGLLVLMALSIGWWSFLLPELLAVSIDPPTGLVASRIRLIAAQLLIGFSIAVAAMSLSWAMRGRSSLITAAWIILGLAVAIERIVLPGLMPVATDDAAAFAEARRVSQLMYGIRLEQTNPSTDTLPAGMLNWNESAWEHGGTHPVSVGLQSTYGNRPIWNTVTSELEPTSRLWIQRWWADSVDLHGEAVEAGASIAIERRSYPGAPDWIVVSEGGVPAGSWLKRLALAWALQAPGVLALEADTRIDWALDPVERLARIAPGLEWSPAGSLVEGGNLRWIISGLRVVTDLPLTTRVGWGGRTVSGIVPSIIATVDASDGAVHLYHDPANDSLGTAWAAALGDVVAPGVELPTAVRSAAEYSPAWFNAQLTVLADPRWNLGRRPATRAQQDYADSIPEVWEGGAAARQGILLDPSSLAVSHLVTARRRDGISTVRLEALGDQDIAVRSRRLLEQAWQRLEGLTQLRDSVRAAGDSLIAGPIRWSRGTSGLLAWQSHIVASVEGPPQLIWVSSALEGRVGGGRNLKAAWTSVSGELLNSGASAGVDLLKLEAAASWLRRGDSALKRGDMTAFGRAWEALRGLLLETPP